METIFHIFGFRGSKKFRACSINSWTNLLIYQFLVQLKEELNENDEKNREPCLVKKKKKIFKNANNTIEKFTRRFMNN